jgi:hypothetical protein
MPKRKHIDFEEDSLSGLEHREDRKGNLQATRLRHKFERDSQLLCRALKTARGFERQKLGRRQKEAKQHDDAQVLQRLEAEVQALKVGFQPASLNLVDCKDVLICFPCRLWTSLQRQRDTYSSSL